ncbi:MAG TPA: hypothetical protein VNZ03_31085 [Terriglobales bacterium]|nr:hypothetical protein [Terriglobales bacterium]
MSVRALGLLALVVVLSGSQGIAKDKTKNSLPDYVLKARTVVIVVAPEPVRPLTDPIQNRTVQEDVEKAFVQWGRLQPVYNVQSADLVVAVRKGLGRTVTPTVSGVPADGRSVGVAPAGRGTVIVGGQQGPPDLSNDPALGRPATTQPQVGTEIGPSDDTFEVYRGRVEYPLDSVPVWRYSGRGVLYSPNVPAVAHFREAIEKAEKSVQHKP